MSVYLMKCATEIVGGLKNVKEVEIRDCGADGKPYMLIYFYKENENDDNELRKGQRYKYDYTRYRFEFEQAFTVEW